VQILRQHLMMASSNKSIDTEILSAGLACLQRTLTSNVKTQMMCRIVLTALLSFCPIFGYSDNVSFSGTWEVKWCPKEEASECRGFTLYLEQKGSRVIGTHWAATPTLGRLDEPDGCSVAGAVHGRTAKIRIRSGRDESVFNASAQLERDTIKWKLEEVESGSGNDSVIAVEAVLRKTQEPEISAHFAKQCAGKKNTF
jgi:hypothetical protein